MPWNGNLPVELPEGGIGNTFRDYIPESEQHLYPGQGMGQTMDYVPEGYSADEFTEKLRLERQLKEFEDERQARRRLAGGAGAAEPAEAAAAESRPAANSGEGETAGAAVGSAVAPADGAADPPAPRLRGRPPRR